MFQTVSNVLLIHTADTSENTYNFRISGNTAQSFNMGVYEEIFFFFIFQLTKFLEKSMNCTNFMVVEYHF